MLAIAYTLKALKTLRQIPNPDAAAIVSKIEAHAANRKTGDVKKLKGSELFRLRHGDYRAVFSVKDNVLEVLNVAHLREIYR